MRERAEEFGGSLSVRSLLDGAGGRGTVVTAVLPTSASMATAHERVTPTPPHDGGWS